MTWHVFKPLEIDGIKIGHRQYSSNCGEFAMFGAGGRVFKPVKFNGFGDSAPTLQQHATQQGCL